MKDTIAWLIETSDPVGTTLYFCHDGDWCSNPNHAYKFQTQEDAERKRQALVRPDAFRVCDHIWVHSLGSSVEAPEKP